MDIHQEKQSIRRGIKELKAQYTIKLKKEYSKIIFEKIVSLEEFQSAKVVMCYWSLDDEVYTHNFIEEWAKSKTILLPVIVGDEIRPKIFKGKKKMEISSNFSISEPIGEFYNDLKNIDLIIVPGVAFDKDKNRLGRGKAYYDKFLPQTIALKVGVCFNFQKLDNIPVSKNDKKMDLVVSD